MSQEHTDAEDEPFKQVCSRYGLAMYFAQVLEHGIVNALVFFDLARRTNGNWTPEQHDEYYEARFSDTLRELFSRLAKNKTLPDGLAERLEECNQRRRLLAHHFFRDAVDDLERNKLPQILERLEDDRVFFHETDRAIDALVGPILARMGMTPERMEQEVARYKDTLASGE